MRVDHKVLLFTDIHMMDEGKTIIGLDPFERFSDGLRHALAHHHDADRIVIMGDLTHYGTRKQYRRVQEILAQTSIPVSLMLGNHDRRDKFAMIFDQPLTLSGHVQETHAFGGLRFITLDTYEDDPDPKHSGFLCPDRLNWLATQLKEANGARVVIAMHHPPFGVGFPGMDRIALSNADAFFEVIAGHNVVQILAGHVHRTIAGNIRGIPLFILKSPCHQMPMDFSADGTAHSIDEPGAYGIMLIGPDSVIVHSEDFALAEAAEPTEDYYSR